MTLPAAKTLGSSPRVVRPADIGPDSDGPSYLSRDMRPHPYIAPARQPDSPATGNIVPFRPAVELAWYHEIFATSHDPELLAIAGLALCREAEKIVQLSARPCAAASA